MRRGIVERVSDSEMERMSHLKTPADMLAVIRMPADGGEAAFPAGELSLCLDGVQDPGNLGTIIRIADWFGIGRVFCSPDSADCYNPKAVQARAISVLPRARRGSSPQAAALVNRKLVIPPFPSGRHGSESLNVAAATAIVCAEFRRRVRAAR